VFIIVLFGVFGGEAFTGLYSDTPGMPDLDGFRAFGTTGVAIAAAALAVSHTASFLVNFVGNKEYLDAAPDRQMFRPYSRVVVLHVTILGVGFLAAYLGTPLASLILMVILKTIIDLWTHVREHRKASEGRNAEPVRE
jgi:flagellar biosynthesis component FlhA